MITESFPLTGEHAAARAKKPAGLFITTVSKPPAHYWVVYNEQSYQVMAVIVPDGLDIKQIAIATAHTTGKAVSGELALLWKMCVVIGDSRWVRNMLHLGNPPFPKAVRLTFL